MGRILDTILIISVVINLTLFGLGIYEFNNLQRNKETFYEDYYVSLFQKMDSVGSTCYKATNKEEKPVQNITTIHNTYIEKPFMNFFPRRHITCTRPEEIYIVGQSMFPLFNSNDKLHMERTTFAQVEVGDVIRYQHKGEYFIHAIIYLNDEYALTQGYNNPYPDQYQVYSSDITHRYCWKK